MFKKEKELDINKEVGEVTEIGFVFDSTGSMRPCIAQVRDQIEAVCEQMIEDIPGLKVAMIAHGDYCDGDNCMNVLNLTDEKEKIFKFIREAPDTNGGDAPECYELALHVAQTLGWSDAPGKALVMIGDATPHPVDYPQNTQNLDWEEEAKKLVEMGVKIFPLECLVGSYFWGKLAEISGTSLLKLGNFKESSEAIMGVAYAAAGEMAFGLYESKLSDKIAKGTVCCSADMCSRNALLRSHAVDYTKMRADTAMADAVVKTETTAKTDEKIDT
jgi:hypothetical protein